MKGLPVKGGVIYSGDDRIENYCEDTMMRGSPDAVVVARDEQEVADILKYCNAVGIPVTFCGSQTSMTGASVPNEGLLISTEKLEGLIDISQEGSETIAVVRPGMVTAEFQKALAGAGYFYPVGPTSRDECRIASNVLTNATGEDSYKYGPARRYVKEIEMILADGTIRSLEREQNEVPSCERNRAGYFTEWKNPIDLVIGSEGTLGFVSRVSFVVLPEPLDFFAALVPFESNLKALKAVIDITCGREDISPRALELIDSGALEHMRTAEGFPEIADDIQALLYVKQEYKDGADRDLWLTKWYDLATSSAGRNFADRIIIALSTKQQEEFRLWRHRVPESANEIGRSHWAAGGGKVGSDWWVPVEKIMEMMEYFYSAAEATGLSYMGYAHIGSGHPHTNFLAKGPEEKGRALRALELCCRKAVELGGGVAGEHGIGKLHTDLMPIQHQAAVIEKMRTWKREYDPKWILGRGNIFKLKNQRSKKNTKNI